MEINYNARAQAFVGSWDWCSLFFPQFLSECIANKHLRLDFGPLLLSQPFLMEGCVFYVFFDMVLGIFFGFLLFCCSCFSAFLVLCFSVCLLFCFSCFSASLLVCFSCCSVILLFLLFCFSAFLLLCFSCFSLFCFPASLLFYFSAFLLLPVLFLQSCDFMIFPIRTKIRKPFPYVVLPLAGFLNSNLNCVSICSKQIPNLTNSHIMIWESAYNRSDSRVPHSSKSLFERF